MSSMPESNESNQRINDSRLPGHVAELRAAAVTALQSWSSVSSPEQAADLLSSWKRRPEMTDEDVAAVLEAMFPHYHVGGSAGGPGENSAECACGVVFDGFDTHAEAVELLNHHIERREPAVAVAGPVKGAGWNEERRNWYAEGYVDCIVQKAKVSPQVQAVMQRFADRHDQLSGPERDAIRTVIAEAFVPGLDGCPDWCTYDHRDDDPADDSLILHLGDDQTDGSVRKLLDVHEGSKLDIRVARCDNHDDGTLGTPNLMVRMDLELTTWQQAAELAHAILDGFGYLEGADQ